MQNIIFQKSNGLILFVKSATGSAPITLESAKRMFPDMADDLNIWKTEDMSLNVKEHRIITDDKGEPAGIGVVDDNNDFEVLLGMDFISCCNLNIVSNNNDIDYDIYIA